MKYKLGTIFGIFGILGVIFGLGIQKAKANPTFFTQSGGTAAATTSPVFMTPGTATTTEQFDSSNGYNQAYDSAALIIQFTGSSTASIINVSIERSQDAIDWYADTFDLPASSSPSSIGLNTANSFSLTFASTTVGGMGGTGSILTRILKIPTPTKYVRSIITIPAGAKNGAVWQRFIGKRQVN